MQPFLICSSVIVLRKKYPDMARPYKVWLYPVSVWLIILIMAGLCLNTLIEDPRTSLIGLSSCWRGLASAGSGAAAGQPDQTTRAIFLTI